MNLSIFLTFALLVSSQTTPLPPGGKSDIPLGTLEAGSTYRVEVTLEGPIGPGDRVRIGLQGPGGLSIDKTLHPGDPAYSDRIRTSASGEGRLTVEASSGSGPVRVATRWSKVELAPADDAAIEAEPNNSWREANLLQIGRAVYGSGDDVDYLENLEEGKSGIDWFRFEVLDETPSLVYFQLELLDRDVSANLKVHRLEPNSGQVAPYEAGKDPTEVIHDRERERYSTHLSRTLARGTYFVEVNANHPDYILRTSRHPVPPLADPRAAVEAGLDYLLEAGDAWFAQIPREGNLFVRSGNLHDTATRCTACHASSFPTEAALVGLANGYPIRAKGSMLYLMDRIANSPTPLYGESGLSWQRFIAIPLQAQGKQGGILLDFENQVLGRGTPEFARFGPFLQAAWRGRRSMPMDEVNGVVPLDSKFGLAWRDWRVLTEMTRRTGRVAYAQAADAIADLLDDPDSDRQVETLQDRIHRVYAWWLVDKGHFAERIKLEAEALLKLQNPDGGWHELDRKPGPSAVYTTGQLTWTLLKVGYSRDDPRIARALAHLLRQQQDFGGWFQTTTHENFRTPMRETRYAVEALAQAYPAQGGPRKGWGNRDGRTSRLPGSGSVVAILDDLENLWEVPEADRPRYALAIVPLLEHPEPLVRARAAACLGRLGDPSAVGPLVERLGDPSRSVGRSAAWALRRLGNQGVGIEAIRAALQSPDDATRRGATRIFAYQFSGMDTRLDLAELLIARADDPDLWTRLQALRSLRQWFYRSDDLGFRRKIVETYLARMAVPDEPVVRKALSEGLYILLDENLGGGVSLQKNLAALPEKFRIESIEGRKKVEREALLVPIMATLESGNSLQREALVRAFDGSFFRGRTYARQPSGMLDVGNDREFGFLAELPIEVLDRAFAALLTSTDATAEVRRRSLQLAGFFQVPGRSANGPIQLAFLERLRDTDPDVRRSAEDLVGRDLDLRGAEDDPGRIASIRRAIGDSGVDRRAILRAVGRNRALGANPEILADLRGMLLGPDPRPLLPVLGRPAFGDEEVLAAIARAWPLSDSEADRLGLLEILLMRPTLIEGDAPPGPSLELLRLAGLDRSSRVREKALEGAGRLRAVDLAAPLIVAGLADELPTLRGQALGLATKRADFWSGPEARRRLLDLLIDPDFKVRDLALSVVERLDLSRGDPALARRLKALANDPILGQRSLDCLEHGGFDHRKIDADVVLSGPKLPSFATFRTRINPLFSRAGDDGQSCIRCHSSSSSFRLAEGDSTEAARSNYRAALRAVDLADPASSLLVCKPMSPQGQEGANGLTHVGGLRWEGSDPPALRSILEWVREASDGVPTPSPTVPGGPR